MAWTGSDAWGESYVTSPTTNRRRGTQDVLQRLRRGSALLSALTSRLAATPAKNWMASARHLGKHAQHHRGQPADLNRTGADAEPGGPNGDSLPSAAQLAARMSHDLRTPLNAVIGFSDLMRNELHGPVGDRRYRDYAEHIAQSGKQLLRATESTLAMTQLIVRAGARDQRHQTKKCCARSVLDAALARSPVSVRVMEGGDQEHACRSAMVHGCFDGYVAAFGHLLTSTEHAFRTVGEARLDVRKIDDQLLILLRTPNAGRDAGADTNHVPGPNAGAAKHVFPREADTLDLYIAQTMLALQGAEMSWVSEENGKALTVRIVLPLAAQQSLPF